MLLPTLQRYGKLFLEKILTIAFRVHVTETGSNTVNAHRAVLELRPTKDFQFSFGLQALGRALKPGNKDLAPSTVEQSWLSDAVALDAVVSVPKSALTVSKPLSS